MSVHEFANADHLILVHKYVSLLLLLGGLSPTTDHLLISLEFSFFIYYLFIFIPNFCGMDISTMHGPFFMKSSSCMNMYVNMFQQHFQGHDVIVTSSTSNLMKIDYWIYLLNTSLISYEILHA